MPNAARTAAACRIARLDRQKFNDLMASGEYGCAPTTTPGVPRIFELHDLIGLHLFTRMIERGRSVKQASEIACRIVGQLKDATNNGRELPEAVSVNYSMAGHSYCSPINRDEDGKPNIDVLGNCFVAAGDFQSILYSEIWNITNLRYEVEKGLAEEARVVGGDD